MKGKLKNYPQSVATSAVCLFLRQIVRHSEVPRILKNYGPLSLTPLGQLTLWVACLLYC